MINLQIAISRERFGDAWRELVKTLLKHGPARAAHGVQRRAIGL